MCGACVYGDRSSTQPGRPSSSPIWPSVANSTTTPQPTTAHALRHAKKNTANATTVHIAGACASAEPTRRPNELSLSFPTPSASATPVASSNQVAPRTPTTSVARNARAREVAVASTCSVRPSCSSPPPCPTTATAKHVTTRESTETTAPRSASRKAPAPPIRRSMSCRSRESKASKLGEIAPKTAPITTTAAVHPSTIGVCTLTASASASPSRGEPVAGPGRAATRPDPRSRRSLRRRASPARASAAPAYRRSSHQRGAPYARSWVFQPKGVSQLSHDASVVSPTARSTYSTPIATEAIAAQVRALADTWQAAAVRPVATRPIPAQDAPKASEPVTGRPPATLPAATSTPSASASTEPKAIAAISGASRSTAVPPSSSDCPPSSSRRVCRRTTNRNISAAKTA